MKNQEILEAAIEQAKDNGLNCDICINQEYHEFIEFGATGIIFTHEFAKAFFGEELSEKRGTDGDASCPSEEWEVHLQLMVLEEDPVKYLEKFLQILREIPMKTKDLASLKKEFEERVAESGHCDEHGCYEDCNAIWEFIEEVVIPWAKEGEEIRFYERNKEMIIRSAVDMANLYQEMTCLRSEIKTLKENK